LPSQQQAALDSPFVTWIDDGDWLTECRSVEDVGICCKACHSDWTPLGQVNPKALCRIGRLALRFGIPFNFNGFNSEYLQ